MFIEFSGTAQEKKKAAWCGNLKQLLH